MRSLPNTLPLANISDCSQCTSICDDNCTFGVNPLVLHARFGFVSSEDGIGPSELSDKGLMKHR